MPRLPDETALGPRPTPRPTRPASGYDASGLARAAQHEGAGLVEGGKAITDLGAAIQSADARITGQREALERQRALISYAEEGADDLRRRDSEEDLSQTETLRGYGEFLAKKSAEAIANHPGGAESRLRLQSRLEQQRHVLYGQAISLSKVAENKMLEKMFGNVSAPLIDQATQNPGNVAELIASGDSAIDDMAPSLPPGREEQMKGALRRGIVSTAVNSLLDRGGIDGAENVIANTPGAVEILGADEVTKIRRRIIVMRAGEEKTANAFRNKISAAEAVLGPLSREEKATLFGLSAPGADKSLSGAIKAYETEMTRATGKPYSASPEDVQRLAKMTDKPAFGGGPTGLSLEIMKDLAPAFAANALSPGQEREFMTAVTHYTQPTTVFNDQGLPETRRPDLPPFVREALERRQIPIPQSSTTQGPQAPPVPEAPRADAGPQPAAPSASAGPTLFERAGKTTGMVAGAKTLIGRTPGVGDMAGSMEETQNQAYATGLTNDIVRVMQNSPRFAEMERAQIKKEVGLEPSMFDTETAYKDRMIAVDTLLEERKKDAFKTINNRRMIGKEDYQRALTLLNDIGNIQQRLGVPARVKTRQEYDKLVEEGALRSGEMFIDPEGNLRKVP